MGVNSKINSNGGVNIQSSFVETNSKLVSTIQTARKTRTTQDSRACAKAFVQDGKTYFDCTKSRSPDGLITNKEWCYVEQTQAGAKKWDYCKPIMDYDKVREANQEMQRLMAIDIKKVNEGISQNITPAQNTLTEVTKLKVGQETLMKNISSMNKELEKINKNLEKLEKMRDAWEKQEKMITDIKFQITQKEEKKKEDEEKLNAANSASDDITDKAKSHMTIFSTKKAKTVNCKGIMLYEDEEQGDGLVGKYYDNENWIGKFIERKDNEIDFDWTGAQPMSGINQNNFSIKWEGYLFLPYSGKYMFTVDSDDGIELIVNNDTLLRNAMNTGLDVTDRNKDVGELSKIRANRIESNKIYLIGGSKVKIVINYFHSIHDDLHEDGQSFLKLHWSSDELKRSILPKKYLFSSNDFPPLKVTGFTQSDAIIRKLYENELAFKNSDRYILQDIPSDFVGSTVLRCNTRVLSSEIKFHLNTPSIVYIAFISHYPNPLPDDFENTGLIMSLLMLDKNQSKGSKKLIAKNSATLEIHKKQFAMGDVSISLNNTGINKSGVPLILFFGFDSRAHAPLTCLGKPTDISNSASATFRKCRSSSHKEGMNCEAGFNGKMRDEEGGMWSSNNEGEEAWIEIEFKGLFEIRKVRYKDKKNPAERNKSIQLVFSSGRSQIIKLKNSDEVHETKIEPTRATSVKITIKEVYGTINNGGAFIFYGVPCQDKSVKSESSDINKMYPNTPEFIPFKTIGAEISPLFERDYKTSIMLTCRESLSNSHKLDNYSLTVGAKIRIKCVDSCASSDAPIYGGNNSNYTKDSAICKAAFHLGKMASTGGDMMMLIKAPETKYNTVYKNGISSTGKNYSEISISFEPYVEEDPIMMKVGTKVDYNPEANKWIKSKILGISDNINGKFVKILTEGKTRDIDLNYPNAKIHPCGSHIKDRNCKGSVRHFISNIPVKIRFTPMNYPSAGDFLPDFGNTYGDHNKAYGWSRVMTDKILAKGTSNNKPEFETLVEFPPSPLSRFCNKPNPESNCEPVYWAVYAGKGKFKVKIYVGDMTNDLTVDLSMNGKSIAKSFKVEKNKMHIFDPIIDSINGFLILSSECVEHCDLAITRINAIEIEPYNDENEKSNIDSNANKESKVECGESFKKGRCDTGPDVLHCLFDDKAKHSASYCSGSYSLVTIPETYMCKTQIGKYKCVKLEYDDSQECKKYCPKICNDRKCLY